MEFVKRCESVVEEFQDFCELIQKEYRELRFHDAKKFETYLLRSELEKGTVNGYVSIVRVFFNYLILIEVADLNPFRLVSSMHVIPFDPPFIPMAQLKKIFASMDKGLFVPIHFITIFECLYASGINGMELMYMRSEDFNPAMETLTIRGTKRKPMREVPLPTQSVFVLKHYINYRKLHFPLSQFLLVSIRGRQLYYGVMNRAVKVLLSGTRVRQKGVPIMKNTYRRHLLGAGVNLQYVGMLTGKRMKAIVRHDGWLSLSELLRMYKMYHPRA